jgi:hypothetical protein
MYTYKPLLASLGNDYGMPSWKLVLNWSVKDGAGASAVITKHHRALLSRRDSPFLDGSLAIALWVSTRQPADFAPGYVVPSVHGASIAANPFSLQEEGIWPQII